MASQAALRFEAAQQGLRAALSGHPLGATAVPPTRLEDAGETIALGARTHEGSERRRCSR
jgi:hypothetical protein